MTVTRDQAQMLATLARDIRRATSGARQWSPDEVMAEIAKLAGQSLAVVGCRVLRAAADPHAERESVISAPGPHCGDFAMSLPMVPNVIDPADRCSVCSLSKPSCRIRHGGHCGTCGEDDSPCDHHEFRSVAQAAKEADAADPAAMPTTIRALKQLVEPTQEAPVKTLEQLKADRPEFAARLAVKEPEAAEVAGSEVGR